MDHTQRIDCECEECEELWKMHGCTHPYKCIDRARDLLDTLPDKWDPRSTLPEDFEREPGVRMEEESDWVVFNQSLVTGLGLTEMIRIFTSGVTNDGLPWFPHSHIQETDAENRTRITIGVKVLNPGNDNARVGTAAVFHEHITQENIEDIKIALPMETGSQTKQAGELAALIRIMEVVPPEMEVEIEGLSV
ncbi:hypothetical protein PQX77_020753 [Marasmius sp. AFHP31]|nr:hypothetical protein PQX77_020753 [Marasmius sp. AFHP31]